MNILCIYVYIMYVYTNMKIICPSGYHQYDFKKILKDISGYYQFYSKDASKY